MMCVPMRTRRGLVGVLYAASRDEASFSLQQLETLQRLGVYAALAIENARLYDEQSKAVEELQGNIATHERFLQLVLDNANLDAIGETLSGLLNAAVVIEDAGGRILCYSVMGGASARSADPTRVLSTRGVLRLPTHDAYLTMVEGCQHMVRIPENTARTEHPRYRFVAPVIAGRERLGYVTAITDGSGQPERMNHTAIQQAAIARSACAQEGGRRLPERTFFSVLSRLKRMSECALHASCMMRRARRSQLLR